jgi:hypothetical protein
MSFDTEPSIHDCRLIALHLQIMFVRGTQLGIIHTVRETTELLKEYSHA